MKSFGKFIFGLLVHACMTYIACVVLLTGIEIAFEWEAAEGNLIYGLRLSALWYGIFMILNHFKQNLSVK